MTKMMLTAFAAVLALSPFAVTPVHAAETDATVDMAAHRIAVVNESDAPIVVYAEAANGELQEVMTLEAGEVKLVDAEVEVADSGSLRLHARFTNSADRWSTWGDRGIVTDALSLSDDETAILWIAPELSDSLVEIRTG